MAIPVGTDLSQGVALPKRKKKKKGEPGSPSVTYAPPAQETPRSVIGVPGEASREVAIINDAWFAATGKPMKVGMMTDMLKAGIAQRLTKEQLTTIFRLGGTGAGFQRRRIYEALGEGSSNSPYAQDPAALAAFEPEGAADLYRGPGVQSQQPYAYDVIDRRGELKDLSDDDLRARAKELGLDTSGNRKQLIERIGQQNIVDNPSFGLEPADDDPRYNAIANEIARRGRTPRKPADPYTPITITHDESRFGSQMASGSYFLYLPFGYGYGSLEERLRWDKLTHVATVGGRLKPGLEKLADNDPARAVKDLQQWLIDRGQGKIKMPTKAGEEKTFRVKVTGEYDEATALAYSNMMIMRNLAPAIIFAKGSATVGTAKGSDQQEMLRAGQEALLALQQVAPQGFPPGSDINDIVARISGDEEKLKTLLFSGWVGARAPGQTEAQAVADYRERFGDGWVPKDAKEWTAALANVVEPDMGGRSGGVQSVGRALWSAAQSVFWIPRDVKDVVVDAWRDPKAPLHQLNPGGLGTLAAKLDPVIGIEAHREIYRVLTETDEGKATPPGSVIELFRLSNEHVGEPAEGGFLKGMHKVDAAYQDLDEWTRSWDHRDEWREIVWTSKPGKWVGEGVKGFVPETKELFAGVYEDTHAFLNRISATTSYASAYLVAGQYHDEKRKERIRKESSKAAAKSGGSPEFQQMIAETTARLTEVPESEWDNPYLESVPSLPEVLSAHAHGWKKAEGKGAIEALLEADGHDPKQYPMTVLFGQMAFDIGLDIGIGYFVDPIAVGSLKQIVKVTPWLDDTAKLAAKIDNISELRSYTGIRDPKLLERIAKMHDPDEIAKLMRTEGIDPHGIAVWESWKRDRLRDPLLKPWVRNLFMEGTPEGMTDIKFGGYKKLLYILRAAGYSEKTVHREGSFFLKARADGDIDKMHSRLVRAEAMAKRRMSKRHVRDVTITDEDGNQAKRAVNAWDDFTEQERKLRGIERGFHVGRTYMPWFNGRELSGVPKLDEQTKLAVAIRRAEIERLEALATEREEALTQLDDDIERLLGAIAQAERDGKDLDLDLSLLSSVTLRYDFEGDETLRNILERRGVAGVRKGSEPGKAFEKAREGGRGAAQVLDELEALLKDEVKRRRADVKASTSGKQKGTAWVRPEARDEAASALESAERDLRYVRGLRNPFRVTDETMDAAGERLARLWAAATKEGADVRGRSPAAALRKLQNWAHRKLEAAEAEAADPKRAPRRRSLEDLNEDDIELLWDPSIGTEQGIILNYRGVEATLGDKGLAAFEEVLAAQLEGEIVRMGLKTKRGKYIAPVTFRKLHPEKAKEIELELKLRVIQARLKGRAVRLLDEANPLDTGEVDKEVVRWRDEVAYLDNMAETELPYTALKGKALDTSRRLARANPELAHKDPLEQARNVLTHLATKREETDAEGKRLADELRAAEKLRTDVLKSVDEKEMRESLDRLARQINGYLDVDDAIPTPFSTWQETTWFHESAPWADVMKYNSGPVIWGLEKIQSTKVLGVASIDDFTNAYKNLVLFKLSTMVRIVLGDEALRLVSEGINPFKIGRYRGIAVQLEKEGKLGKGISGAMEELLDQAMKNNYRAFSMTDDAKVYPKVYIAFIERERAEPFMPVWRDVMAATGDPEQAKQAVRDLIANNDEVRDFIERRYKRVDDDDEIAELVEQYVKNRSMMYEYYWKHQLLRRHLFGELADNKRGWKLTAIDPAELKTIDSALLPPVVGRTQRPVPTGNVLTRFATGQTGAQRALYGTLDGLSRKLRETVFGHEFEKQMKVLEELRPFTSRAKREELAIEKALEATDRAMYSAGTSMAENLLRNTFLFLPAYRQFAQYWLRQFALHPIAMGGTFTELQKMPNEVEIKPGDKGKALAAMGGATGALVGAAWGGGIGALAGGATGAAAGYVAGESMPDDVGLTVNPRTIMFLTGGTGGPEENFFAQFMPGLGPIFVVPAEAMGEIYPQTLGNVHKVPGFSFARPGTPVHAVVDKLVYGILGETAPRPIGKDPNVRRRYELNAWRMAVQRYWELKRENPAADIKRPEYEDIVNDLRKMEATTGLLNFFIPVSMKAVDLELERHLDTEWAYIELENERLSAGPARAAEIDKLEAELLKGDPTYAKVIEYWTLGNDKKDEFLNQNPEVGPWVQGSYAVDETTGRALTQEEFFAQWFAHNKQLLRPEQLERNYWNANAARQNRSESSDVSAELTRRDEWFEKLARKKGLNHYSEQYQLLRREFEQSSGVFGAGGGYSGRGLYDFEADVSQLPKEWVHDLTEDAVVDLNMLEPEQKKALLGKGATRREGLGDNAVQFGLFVSRLPYGEEFVASSANYGEYQTKVAELRARNIGKLLEVAAFRKNRLTMDDWESLGYRVSPKVVKAEQELSQAYEAYQKTLKVNGWAWNSQEGKAARKEMLAKQNAIINSDKEVKAVLSMGVAERLRNIVRVDEPHYLRPTLRQNPTLQEEKLAGQQWQQWERVRKTWEKSDKMPGELEDELYDRLSPEMQANYREMVRAWSWRQVISVSTQIRDILKSTYNKWTGVKGWSPESVPGKYYKAQLEQVVKGLVGLNDGMYAGQAIGGTEGSASMFAKEWKEYGGDELYTKLVDWTY